MLTETTEAERRQPPDRRLRHPLLCDWRWGFRGRRNQLRRDRDHLTTGSVVDTYPSTLLLVTLGVFVLSAVDASSTLLLIQHGVTGEANPLMGALLERNVHLFFGVKALVTGAGLVALVAYSHLRLFNRYRLGHFIYLLLGAYALLVGYEVSLLAHGIGA